MKTVNVGGISVTPFDSLQQAASFILDSKDTSSGFAVAINAEKVISSQKSNQLKNIIEGASLRYADGISVVWAMKRKGASGARIPGCELWQELMLQSAERGSPVYLVGGTPEVNEQTGDKLKKEVGVKLVGSQHGFFDNEQRLIQHIAGSGAKLVTVAMGSPAQEKFIAKCLKEYPDAFYMGVGGTYDVYVGNVKRAPCWMQRCHLEWAYRLLKQPTRFLRQVSLIKFLFMLVSKKL